jgi:tetratricopeptide (TPR) repeat protein
METHTPRVGRLDRLLLVIASLSVVWAVIGFIPGVASDIAKGFGFLILALVAGAAVVIQGLVRGSVPVSREPVVWAAGGIAGTTIISAIVSGIFRTSFWGVLGQSASVISILAILGFFLIGLYVGRIQKSIQTVLLILLAALPVIVLLLCVQVGLPSFSIFVQKLTAGSGTLAGSWKSAWMLAGGLLVAHTILLAWRPRLWQWIATGFLFLAFFILAPRAVWVTAGASFLLLTLVVLSVRERFSVWGSSWVRAASIFAGALVISLLAVWFGSFVQAKLVPAVANIQSGLIVSVPATLRADGYALRQHPIFGPTPAAFSWAFQESVRPDARIMSWWRSVGTGTSFILTVPMMFGIVGILAWLFFIVTLVATVLRRVPTKAKKAVSEASTEGAKFNHILWGGLLIYLVLTMVRMPVTLSFLVVMALALGIFVRLCAGDSWKVSEFSYIKDPRSGLLGTLGLFGSLALLVVCAGAVARMGGSEWSLARAQVMASNGNAAAAQQSIIRSAAWWKHPRTLIASAQVYSGMIQDRVSQADTNQAVVKSDVQQLVGSSLAAARQAVSYAPRDASVRGAYADLLASLSTIGIQGARDEAIAEYDATTTIAAYDNLWTIKKATLIAVDNKPAAEALVRSTLGTNPTYEALQLLANLKITQGDRSGALAVLEQGFSLLPWNSYLFRDAGLVSLSLGNGTKARDAFDRAIGLGLSDQLTIAGAIRARQMTGQTDEASKLLERAKIVYPNIGMVVTQLGTASTLPVAEEEAPTEDTAPKN